MRTRTFALSLAGKAPKWVRIGDSGFSVLRGGGAAGSRLSKPQRRSALLHRGPLPLAANENSDDVICADVGTTGTRAGDVVVRWSPDGHSDNPGVRCPVSVA